jgi:hypothetical protein
MSEGRWVRYSVYVASEHEDEVRAEFTRLEVEGKIMETSWEDSGEY